MTLFSPYHRFDNCRRLEAIVSQLERAGNVSASVSQGYKTYHYALIYKLKCAKHHLERLEAKLTTSAQEAITASSDFMFAVNMSIDGFFYAGGSALDILAREVLTYFGEPLPDNVYFYTAREILTNNRPGDSIICKLGDPSWKGDFSNYRNSLTHELIIAETFTINVQQSGNRQETTVSLPLPDDPRVEPSQRTFRRNPDVLGYAKSHMRRLLSLVNQIYGELCNRIVTEGRLPL